MIEANDDSGVLWDVAEEHLEEAAYGLGQFWRALQSPMLGLEELARHPEWRLLAHVDALAVGGAPVRERLLLPALEAADPAEPGAAMAAAWALIIRGEFAHLQPVLAGEHPALRHALADVASLAASSALDAWIRTSLELPAQDFTLAGLLELAAARQLPPPAPLMAWLQSEDGALVEAAARAARFGNPATYLPILQHLLDHPNPGVRDASMLATLAWGSQHAWLRCQTLALDEKQPSALATHLYAALGTRGDQLRLAALLDAPGARTEVLSVLGFTGNIELRETLLPLLDQKHPLEPKLASQALGMIFGFLPGADAYALYRERAEPGSQQARDEDANEAAAALPALEDDELDADLVPMPEDGLPTPKADTIRALCTARARDLPSHKRVLFGAQASPAQLAHVFRVGPLGWHHALALAHGVRSGGETWIDTRTTSASRRAQEQRIKTATWKRHLAF